MNKILKNVKVHFLRLMKVCLAILMANKPRFFWYCKEKEWRSKVLDCERQINSDFNATYSRTYSSLILQFIVMAEQLIMAFLILTLAIM